jgi:hypothetical protein
VRFSAGVTWRLSKEGRRAPYGSTHDAAPDPFPQQKLNPAESARVGAEPARALRVRGSA